MTTRFHPCAISFKEHSDDVRFERVDATDLGNTSFDVFNEVLKIAIKKRDDAAKTRLPSAYDTNSYCPQSPSELKMRHLQNMTLNKTITSRPVTLR